MKLTGMVLRNDDTIPEDLDLNAVALPETAWCTVNFDPTKRVGQARLWRDDDGNIMAEVEVAEAAEKYIVDDYSRYSIGKQKARLVGVSPYQFLSCSVILPIAAVGGANRTGPSLLDVSVVTAHANTDVPPMVIS